MNYYYLIAGLPDLSLDSKPKKIDFTEIVDTIQRNLELFDEKLFRYVLYPNDNQNLLNTLFEKYKGFPQAEHLLPAVFSEKEIREYHKNAGIFPTYMGEFLLDYADQFQTMSILEMEERLLQLFYEEMEQIDPFLARYYQFERELKKLFFAYNHSYFDFLTSASSLESTVLAQVGKGKSVPTDVLRAHPYTEAIGEAISSHKPYKIEKLMDRIKWDYLEDVKGFFGIEQVLVYMIRLLMIKRWESLVQELGLTHFAALQATIKDKVRSHKTDLT